MSAPTHERDVAHQDERESSDVGRSTFYGLMLVVAVGSGIVGFAMPLVWLLTALAVGFLLLGNQAEQSKQEMEQAKGAALDKAERAGGCATSLLLGLALFVAFFVALLSAGGRLP